MTTVELAVPPDEGISSLHFSPHNQTFLGMSTWAGTVRIYNVDEKQEISHFNAKTPLLCSLFLDRKDDNVMVAGGIDGSISVVGNSINSQLLGHTDGVTSLSISPDSGFLVSGSWDQSIALWDLNQPPETAQIGTVSFNEKIMFSSACSENRIVAYGNHNTVFVLDARQPDHYERRVSSLGKQIRSFSVASPIDYGWAVGSIDGRIAIEYFGDIRHQAQRFSFSCNRQEEGDKTIVYPVSSLAFHPITGILASGSVSGSVYFWDVENKRKLTEVQSPFHNSVSALSFNNDGSLLGIAYSYTWDKGNIEHPEDHVLLFTPNAQNVSHSHPFEE